MEQSKYSKGSVVILCAGGPAPGINTVISSVTKIFVTKGYRVIGLNQGYKSLVSDEPNTVELTFDIADKIFNKGGSFLQMSRYKPKDSEFSTRFFEENDVRLLVTIGGDDTASTANRLSKYLHANNVEVANIHVPKTIDNDLPLPYGQPTFGYNTAREEGVRIANTVYEDARTSGNWFLISAMGREAGHLAWGIGAACHSAMIVVPEMFNKTVITFDKIVRLVVSSMIKRKLMGIDYGMTVVSEGVFHFLADDEFKKTGITFDYDEHGHPELNAISKSHIFSTLIGRELKKYTSLNIKCRPEEMGYELRCCSPAAFDLYYATKLGLGVYELFTKGITGCMVTLNDKEDVMPLYLKDVEDENGKIKPRLLDIESNDISMIIRDNMQYLTSEDMSSATKYVATPERYDFNKILNW